MSTIVSTFQETKENTKKSSFINYESILPSYVVATTSHKDQWLHSE